MSVQHSGSCLCGAVSFKVNGPMREVVYCHCSQCRKQTGHYYAASNCAETDLVINGGETISWYHSSEKGKRGFCSNCGSALFWKYEGAEEVSVLAGSLDQAADLTKGYHIFCADKGDYYEITDGLAQFPKASPGLMTNDD